MEMNFDYDFNKVVKELLDEYEFEYEYDEEEDAFFTGIYFDDLQDVTMIIVNNGNKIMIIGEIDFTIENDMVYFNTSQFVHRFNSLDCNITLFLDPDAHRMYYKKQINVMDSFDPQFAFARDFLRVNMELDMFGKAIADVMKGILSDSEGIEQIWVAMDELNDQLLHDAGQYMN